MRSHPDTSRCAAKAASSRRSRVLFRKEPQPGEGKRHLLCGGGPRAVEGADLGAPLAIVMFVDIKHDENYNVRLLTAGYLTALDNYPISMLVFSR